MRPARVVVLSVVILAVVAPVGAAGPALGHRGATPATDVEPRNATSARAARPDPYLIMNITVQADGDARWRVSSRFFVRTENRTEAFRTLVDRVQAGETDPGYSADVFRRYVELAEEVTKRDGDMRIVDANWSGVVHNETARLILSFTWTNFARVANGNVIVESAFYSPSGTWLPRLADGQRLVINAPPGYLVESATAAVSNGTVTWAGPQQFERGDIRVVYVPTSTTVTTTSTSPPPTSPPTSSEPPGRNASPLFWAGLLLLIAAVGGGGYLLARQRGGKGPTDGEAPVADADDLGTVTEASSTAGPVATSGTAEADDPSDGDGDAAAVDDDPVDPELLSDEERVERLLRENGGRMKQANIVSETGWSNAKVSQLLSSMDDEDRIDKLRIGRENLITLPDEDVAEFDEE